MVEVTDTPPKLPKTKPHTIEAVIDRLVIREGIRPRLAESLDLALKLADGRMLALVESSSPSPSSSTPVWDERLMSVHLACPACGTSLPAIEPRSFSFNSPHGACPGCDGLGSRGAFQAELSIPDRSRSWSQGAVIPWTLLTEGQKDPGALDAPVRDFVGRHGLDDTAPLETWTAAAWQSFWHGEPGGPFAGLGALLERAYEDTRRESLRRALDAYREEVVCPACDGSRLRPEARAVRFGGQSIRELTATPVGDLLAFVKGIMPLAHGDGPNEAGGSDPASEAVTAPLLGEIAGRLQYLVDVGLEYLSLDRGSDTLSGGELQRARLAAQLGSGLVGVCYILDEPTAGLHPRDTARLVASLRRLQELGNSVLVVEHDESVIRAADWVVNLGPGAGPDGGAIVAAAPPDRLSAAVGSVTARYLDRTPTPLGKDDARGRLAGSPGWIEIRGAAVHNLQHVDTRMPLRALTCVTGVSGSGKSSLVHDVLARCARLGERSPALAAGCGVRGAGKDRGIVSVVAADEGQAAPIGERGIVSETEDSSSPHPAPRTPQRAERALPAVLEIDQAPIGRTPRSTPATATGLFDEIRRVFAKTREARIRGYGPSRFSFNARGGRCEVCLGLGQRRIPMHYLPDLYVTCEECGGKRYNRQTLEVRFKEKSIGDVLEMRVDESRAFFDAVPRVLQGLEALHDVGLGYLTLGQSSTTLSGGEAQRVKLAAELGRPAPVGGRSLYILDEPTTGLHFADIDRLLHILHRLVDLGHTVVVIEHHLDVIASADWVIDLGPEAGETGGRIVAMGPPDAIAAAPESHTGLALRRGIGIDTMS